MATSPIRDILAPVDSDGALSAVRNEKVIKQFLMFSLLLGGTLIYFYLPWLTNRQSYYQSDLTYYFQPFTTFIAESYQRGQLPLWNPYLYCGMSQAAVPSPSMFYPPIVFFVIPQLSFSQSLASYLVFHQLAAGVGAFLLVASLGWGAFAASVCGLAFALCGFMFAFTCNYTLLATVVWLPLLLYALRCIDGNWSRANIVRMFGAAMAMFMMVAAGRPELSVPSALIAAGYVTVSFVTALRDDKLVRTNIGTSIFRLLSMFLGGLLAGPILLPAVEWVKLSPRQNGLDLQWVLMWSANWYDAVCMFFAQPLGDLTILGSHYLNLVASRQNAIPFLNSTYVGPVVLTLALWGLFDRNWRWRWWMLALFAATLIMAMGNYTPVAPFICKLSPAFASFRYPVKLMIFPMAILCIAAARGAYVASDLRVGRVSQLSTAVLWAAIGLIGLLFLFDGELCQIVRFFPWVTSASFNQTLLHQAQIMFGKSFCLAAGLGGLVCANYLAYKHEKLSQEMFSGLTACTIVITLLLPAMSYLHHGTVSNFYSRPVTLAAEIKKQLGDTSPNVQSHSTASTSLQPQASSPENTQKFRTRAQTLFFDPLTPGKTFLSEQKMDFQKGFFLYARQMMLQNSNVDLHVPYAFGYEAAEVGSYKELFSSALAKSSQNRQHDTNKYESDAPMARFCQMTSVSTVMTQSFRDKFENKVEPLNQDYFTLTRDDPDLNVRIYRTKQCNPRAYFARDLQWSTRWNKFFSMFLDSQNKNFLDQTYLEIPPETGITSNTSTVGDSGYIKFVSDENNSVQLDVNTPETRLLVLTDHYYPGWICTIDGRDTRIVRINFFARGVFVPAGAHTVRFVYRPASVTNGFYISAGVLLIFLVAWVIAGVRRSPCPDYMDSKWQVG